jgi:hypothetical protein
MVGGDFKEEELPTIVGALRSNGCKMVESAPLMGCRNGGCHLVRSHSLALAPELTANSCLSAFRLCAEGHDALDGGLSRYPAVTSRDGLTQAPNFVLEKHLGCNVVHSIVERTEPQDLILRINALALASL